MSGAAMNRLFCCLAFSVVFAQGAVSSADELKGSVKKDAAVRIARPISGQIQQSTLRRGMSTDLFNLGTKGAAVQPTVAPLDINAVITSPSPSKFATSAATTSPPPTATQQASVSTSAKPSEEKTGSGSGDPLNYDYSQKDKLRGAITFRFTYFDLGDGPEVTWEGLRDALYLQGRGADVTLILDRAAVRLANKHDIREYQLHRGSTERAVKNSTMLREFIDRGGKVFASERWARTFGLSGGSNAAVAAGVELASDEQMAELLLQRSGSIVNY